MRRQVPVGLLSIAAAALLACGDDLGPRVPAAIAVTPEAPEVPVAGTLQLIATVVDASGRAIPGQRVSFRSSDTTILTVDDVGLLTSVAEAGSSLIAMASGDLTAEVEAQVVLPPSAIVVSPRTLEVDNGEQHSLHFTVTDENGEALPGAQVGFQGSDPTVVRVEKAGFSDEILLITGLGVGTATVTLSRDGLTAEVPVTVGQFPASVAITPTSLVLPAGGAQQVTATLFDRSGDAMELLRPFTWSSSDPAVVTVSSTGGVTSAGPEGSAVITATTDTFSATLPVFVGTPPAGEKLAKLSLLEAEGLALTPDGRYYVSGENELAIGALPDFELPVRIPVNGGVARDVVVNADATRAYLIGLSSFQRGVVVIDLTTRSQVDFIPVSLGHGFAGALSPDGSVLFVGTENGFERIDIASKQSLGGTAVGRITKLTHHPSEPLLYGSGGGAVVEIDGESGEILRRAPAGGEGHVVSPDGKRLYKADITGGIGVWNLETGAEEPSLENVFGTDLALSPDGRFLYVMIFVDSSTGSLLNIVDPASGAVLRRIVLGGAARRIAMSSDGIAVISNESLNAGVVGWVDFVR